MKGYVQTITGPVKKEDLGITLPHEHLFNDLSGCVDESFYAYSKLIAGKKVSPAIAYGLRYDPYCNQDNMAEKEVEDVVAEVNNLMSVGGKSLVDATGSRSIGRNVPKMLEVAKRTGLQVIASTGRYLSKFEGEENLLRPAEEIAAEYEADLNQGMDGTDIKAGLIGELGVSPLFTPGEHNNLRAGALAQLNNPDVSVNIHMPGWLRYGDEVLDILLDEMHVNPRKVSLAHSDPSGEDPDYQRRLLDRGVWLEFDMIAQDISFPKEGMGPSVMQTADVIAALIKDGYASQLVLSHDVFLKQMYTQNGGNGFLFAPTVFLDLLAERGVEAEILRKLCIDNPAELLA